MKVTVIPIVLCAHGTVTNGLTHGLEDLEISGRVETLQTTALLRSARILSRVLKNWWRPAVTQSPVRNHRANTGVTNPKRNMKVTVIPIKLGALGTVAKRVDNGTGGFEKRRASGDHAYDSFIKIGPEP